MSDILKEAIADAKAVRETALQNAKAALEEAFAPHLKNMLSAKISEEDMDDEMHDDEAEEEMGDDHEEEAEETWHEEMDSEEEVEEAMHDDEEEEGMHKDEAMHDDEEEEGVYEEEDDEELDLEAIIKELEAEVNEAEHEDDDDEEIEENDVSSDIGNGDNKQPGKANQSSNVGNGKNESKDTSEVNEEDEDAEDEEAKVDESKTVVEGIKAELAEYKEAVEFLQDKLHEVNILNAKLLFTNKLFKEYALDKDQKMKVVETMDRAQSTREIKLVYSTLAEAFSQTGKISRKQTVKESASKAIGSTAPKKIISEENVVANRFKKLAGII
jgi:hypothetical protein